MNSARGSGETSAKQQGASGSGGGGAPENGREEVSTRDEQTTGGGDEKPAEPGTLRVRMIPWGTPVVDGREFERGSQFETTLAPGRHRVQMRQGGQVVVERTVRIRAGESRSIELVAP